VERDIACEPSTDRPGPDPEVANTDDADDLDRFQCAPIMGLSGAPASAVPPRPVKTAALLMTTGEVAELFGVKPATIRRWVSDGVLTVIRLQGVGIGHRFLADEVRAFHRISWYSRQQK
jgi:excisionase family DNA binding protein